MNQTQRPPAEPDEPAIDLRDVLWKARQHAWLIALPIIGCLCGAAVYYRFSTPIYASHIVVSIEGSVRASPAIDPLVEAVLDRTSPRERVTVVESKVLSRSFLRVLVDRLGMSRDPVLLLEAQRAPLRWKGITPEEYAMRVSINRLQRKISVSPGRANLIQIQAMDTDPQTAQRLAEMIGDALIEESRLTTLERVQARGEFSSDQISVYEDRVRQAEEALRDFQESRLRKDFSSGAITSQNLGNARNLLNSTEDAMEQVAARIQTAREEWRSTLGEMAVPELKSSHTVEAVRELGDLEARYALALLRPGTENRTESDALQARIAAGRQALFSEFEQLAQGLPATFAPEVRAGAAGIALDRAVLSSLASRRDRIASEIATYLKSVESSPRDDMQLQRLQQNVVTSREFLATLRREATSSRMNEALASSRLGPRLEVVEQPLLPLQPSAPLPGRIFGLAILVGPVIGVGSVFAAERLGGALRTLEQAELEYGQRVLGMVPRIDGWSRPGSYLENHWAALAVLVVLLLTGIAFAFDIAPKARQQTTSQNIGLSR